MASSYPQKNNPKKTPRNLFLVKQALFNRQGIYIFIIKHIVKPIYGKLSDQITLVT